MAIIDMDGVVQREVGIPTEGFVIGRVPNQDDLIVLQPLHVGRKGRALVFARELAEELSLCLQAYLDGQI